MADKTPILTADHSVFFSIGSLDIKWYGFFIGLAFLLVIALICLKLWKWYKLPVDPFYYFCCIAVPTAIIGARIGSVIIGQTSFTELFQFTDNNGQFMGFAGLSIQYGVLFTAIVAVIYFSLVLRKPKYMVRDIFATPPIVKQVSMLVYLDAIAPAVLFGQVLGRWGNYMNQELYGPEVTNPGAIKFLQKVLPYMNKDGVWYQPWFLYESTANFFGFILLFFIIDRYFKWKKSGDLFFGYILFYGIVRICLEPMRQGDSSEIVGHSVNIITSVLWIVFGAGLIAYNHLFLSRFRHKKLCLICWNETIFFFIRIFTPEKRKENLRNSKCLARRSNYSREIAETLYYRGF